MQPDYVFLIWLVHLQKEPERESYNYFHFNARASSTNGKYGTLLNYFRFHNKWKFQLKERSARTTLKKKKKMVRLNYYVLKNGHSENYLLLWLMTPPQADDTDTEIQSLGKLLDCIHSCQMSTRINPAVKPWQTPANFKRSWVNFSTSREKKYNS